jgi:arylsulfatase A-like enzyme
MVLGLELFAQANHKPNFVFILTDDQPYGYMGVTGNKIVKTPNLDRLAKDGVLFTKAYITSAICTPSRISIFLSQYERKHGVNFNSGTSVAPEAWAQSYPMVMRRAGYYTGYVGKNHAPIGNGGYESGLMEKSFDYWYAGHGHLSFYPKKRHPLFKDAEADTQAEIIGEGILDFLDNNKNLEGAVRFLEERPNHQPFALSVCFNLPHNAGTSTMELRENDPPLYKSLYRDKNIPLPEHYIAKADIKEPKLPSEVLRVENRQNSYDYVDTPETLKERYIRHMQAMTGIDLLIGTLREKLKELKLENNTIIIFTSDHGIFNGQFGLGGKALCYEYTTHVPMIMYNPMAPKRSRGLQVDELVQSIDVAPTMLSLAGIPIPEEFQGKDLSGILKGDLTPVRKYIFTENLWSSPFGNPRCEAVQDKEWKYIRYYKNNNLPATRSIEVAKQLGIDQSKLVNVCI